ncbi:MAG: 4Fe-4S binding protein, partial [Candidatus Desulfovibrio faecigallinarum]|nr:4Fe-4S binding protein [Candidatus Desulfovibrio faecigallinarum]
MEAVTTQDITVNDLQWKIEYRPEQCTLCGSCVAACTFGAIYVDMERLDKPVFTGSVPEGTRQHRAM